MKDVQVVNKALLGKCLRLIYRADSTDGDDSGKIWDCERRMEDKRIHTFLFECEEHFEGLGKNSVIVTYMARGSGLIFGAQVVWR